ncbi:MAG: Gfo/Idh/MocA family oxidoreductase [Eubacteriales bacterium]|nr:Gfo/Idh/MocA family oxidoreductase [Eubacteriales bacterium]
MKQLKVAIVGCGVVAAKHLRAIHTLKKAYRLCAVVDARPEAAVSLLKRFKLSGGGPSAIGVYDTVSTMLEECSPDLVAVTTPSGSHYSIALASLNAGCHVLVEKPLTLDLKEARHLLAVAEQQGLQIAVGHIYRFFPLVGLLRDDLRSGRFGRLFYGDVKVRWGHDQAYYDQAAWRGTWHADGGALMNQSIHALDLMTWLLGQPVERVSGWIDRQAHVMEAEDFGLAMLQLANGVYCQLEGTTNTDPKQQEASFYICGSDGEIRAGIRAGKPYVKVRDRSGRRLTRHYLWRYVKALLRTAGPAGFAQLKNPHTGLYRDLADAISQHRPPLADGRSGLLAVEQVLAIYQSALTGQAVQLPLADFQLQDMSEALPLRPPEKP